MFTVHFYDNYGYGALNADTRAEMEQTVDNLRNDPNVEDIWITDNSYEE